MRRRFFVVVLACALGLLAACSQGPSRIEILRHKRAVITYRREKDRFFKTAPDSPLSVDQRLRFHALLYFPVDISWRLDAVFTPAGAGATTTLTTTTGQSAVYRRAGRLVFTLQGRPRSLIALYPEDAPAGKGPERLFVPFTDQTNGKSTYAQGRYLDIPYPGEGGAVELDFNRADNPYCAYQSIYDCPLPPAANDLPVAVTAGEKSPPDLSKTAPTSAIPRFEP